MKDLRNKINQIDGQILDLLGQRMEVSKEVGRYKIAKGLPVLDRSREEAILRRLEKDAGPELRPLIKGIYEEIFALSRYLQVVEGKAFGLVGHPLGHSKSPQIHKNFLYDYRLFDLAEEDFHDFMVKKDFDGINVTIPCKIKVMDYLDQIDPAAQAIGAVNTVVKKDGILIGYNTDYAGLKYSLDRIGLSLRGKKVLILGSGGASKTCQALAKNQAAKEIRIISRTGPYNYENLEESKDFEIIINASPIGMYPSCPDSRLDLGLFTDLEAVVDLVYNPLKTKLVLDAEDLGLKTQTGLAMLVGQAYEAARLFTGQDIPARLVEEIRRDLEGSMKNIALIGMPGSGKSTLGRILSDKLGKEFIDTDEKFEEEFGLSPESYIDQYGEPSFRDKEEQIVQAYGKEASKVISLGGGSILSRANRDALRQNSFIIYLDRPLDKLESAGRPLSSSPERIQALYDQRAPIYESLAQVKVKVEVGNIEASLDAIMKGLENENLGN